VDDPKSPATPAGWTKLKPKIGSCGRCTGGGGSCCGGYVFGGGPPGGGGAYPGGARDSGFPMGLVPTPRMEEPVPAAGSTGNMLCVLGSIWRRAWAAQSNDWSKLPPLGALPDFSGPACCCCCCCFRLLLLLRHGSSPRVGVVEAPAKSSRPCYQCLTG
jgi:hypothetical protein